MNFKTTLVLLVLLAIVAAYVFFVAGRATPTYEVEEARRAAGEERGRAIFEGEPIKLEAVTRVIIRRGDEGATFEKVGGAWLQVEPVRFPADSYKLDTLVRAASDLRYVDRVTPGKDGQPSKKDLTLDPARATITLAAGDRQHTLAIGRKSTGGRGYVALEGAADVLVVDDALQSQLFTPEPLSSWRRTTLAVPSPTQMDALTIATVEATITATRHDGRWYLGEGKGQRASEEAVAALVRGVGYLSIREFVEGLGEDFAALGLERPQLTLSLGQVPAAEGEPPVISTLRIGNAADLKEESLYATWTVGAADEAPSRAVFTVARAAAERLAKKPDDLRDDRILPVTTAADVTGVAIEQSDVTIQLQRDGDTWRFADAGPEYGVDAGAVAELLDTLFSAEAEHFKPVPAEPSPLAMVHLRLAGRDNPEILRLYAASGEEAATHLLSVREGERIAYAVPRERLERLLAPPLALRDKAVLELQPDAIRGVTIERGGGEPPQRFQREGETWSLVGAAAFEREDFERLLSEIARLRAESWVTDGRSPGDEATALTLQLSDGAKRLRVDPGTRIAALDGVDAAFILPPPVAGLLTAEFRDRTVLSLTLGDIQSVTLTENDRGVTIRRGAMGSFEAEGGDVDEAAAATVFDALAGLRAERYVQAPQDIAGQRVQVRISPQQGEPRDLMILGNRVAWFSDDPSRAFRLSPEDAAKIVAPIAPELAVSFEQPEPSK